MNNTKRTRTQLRDIQGTLQRHEEASRKSIEALMFDIGIGGGHNAVKEQVRFLRRIKKGLDNQPGMADVINMLDWAMECCWKQDPSYSEGLDRFIQETCG